MQHTHYKKNYLNEVVFQLNYTIDSLKTTIPNALVTLCENISKVQMSEQLVLNFQFTISGKLPTIQENIKSWVFDGEKFGIQIQHNTIIVRDKRYIRHDEFHDAINSIVSLINKTYQPTCSRIALRYNNIISFPTGNTFDFDGLIHEHLLNSTLFFSDEGLSRSIGAMNIIDQDGIKINFVYGFLNQKEFPNRISKREFILDYDCSFDDVMVSPVIQQYLAKLRSKVNYLFNKSILDNLKNEMDV